MAPAYRHINRGGIDYDPKSISSWHLKINSLFFSNRNPFIKIEDLNQSPTLVDLSNFGLQTCGTC